MESVHVRGVAVSRDNGVLSLGFDLGVAEQALILSCSPEGEHCLVAEPGQRTACEAVTSWTADGSIVELTLTEQAATTLEVPRHIALELGGLENQPDALQGELEQVIGTPRDANEAGPA